MPLFQDAERRKHKRFVTPRAICIHFGNFCRVENICTGGLLFKCFLAIELPVKWSLDIILCGTDIRLLQYPVKLVWKAPVEQVNNFCLTSRNIAVQFDVLHQFQQELLEDFLVLIGVSSERLLQMG